jgi:hypothetical protein
MLILDYKKRIRIKYLIKLKNKNKTNTLNLTNIQEINRSDNKTIRVINIVKRVVQWTPE